MARAPGGTDAVRWPGKPLRSDHSSESDRAKEPRSEFRSSHARRRRDRHDADPALRRSRRDRGQATVGLELLHQAPRALGAVFVPVGGGLAAGIASDVKEIRPEIRVIGVQAEDSDATALSIAGQAARDARSRPHLRRRRRGEGDSATSAAGRSTTSSPSARRSRTPSRTPARCSSPPARCRSRA
jgi:Pyridoxal-phosphate dependent enzyme